MHFELKIAGEDRDKRNEYFFHFPVLSTLGTNGLSIQENSLTLFGSCRDIFVESNNFSSLGVVMIVKKFLENMTFIIFMCIHNFSAKKIDKFLVKMSKLCKKVCNFLVKNALK